MNENSYCLNFNFLKKKILIAIEVCVFFLDISEKKLLIN